MIYKSGENYYGEFITTNPSTGQAQNMDGTATISITVNGIDSTNWTTVNNLEAGKYSVSGIVPSEYTNGSRVYMTVTVTVNGITGKDIFDNFTIESARQTDIQIATSTIIENTNSLMIDSTTIIENTNIISNKTNNLIFDSSSNVYSHPVVSAEVTLDSTDLLQIADIVWSHSTRSITQNGNGIHKVTIIYTDSTSLAPIPDVAITIRNSTDTISLAILYTDSNGEAEVFLDDGIYLLRPRKGMVTFPTTQTINVVGDQEFELTGSQTIKAITVVPGLQTIYGRIIKVDGTPDSGQVISAVVKTPMVIDNALLSRTRDESTTDINGDFELRVMKGIKILLSMTNYFSKEIIVTQDDIKDFSDYIS